MEKSLTNDPRVQLQTGLASFGGSIDPTSQQIFSEYASLYIKTRNIILFDVDCFVKTTPIHSRVFLYNNIL